MIDPTLSKEPDIETPANEQEHKGPELFFGLIGAVGTDLKNVEGVLSRELQTVNYLAHDIRLSALLKECAKYKMLERADTESEHERIRAYMDAGDDFRRTSKRGDAVSLLAMGKVREVRSEIAGDARRPVRGASIHF